MVKYEFKSFSHTENSNFIFQSVRGRALSAVYHSHDFYEMICFLRGGGTKIVNGDTVSAKEKDVILFRPGDSHCFIGQSDDVEIISLAVKKEEFELFEAAFALPHDKLCRYHMSSRCGIGVLESARIRAYSRIHTVDRARRDLLYFAQSHKMRRHKIDYLTRGRSARIYVIIGVRSARRMMIDHKIDVSQKSCENISKL